MREPLVKFGVVDPCDKNQHDRLDQNVSGRPVTRDCGSRIAGGGHDPRKSAMLRTLLSMLSISSMLAACTPSPQKAAMPSPSPVSGATVQGSSESSPQGGGSLARTKIAPDPLAASPAAALGRRILSTAFVRVGPDGHLTVDLHDGRVLVLRHVVMRPEDYCGEQVAGDPARARYCGGYAEVAAARPGGAPAPAEPDRAVSNPVGSKRSPAERP